MSILINYPSIFTFPLLPLHHWSTAMHPHTDAIALVLTSLDWSCLFDGHMFYNSHVLFLFLVSPMCALPQSNQSRTLALCSQALTIASLWISLSCLPFVFNLPVFTFHHIEEPHNCLYEFPPELRFSTYASHHITSHYLAIPLSLLVHRTWRWSLTPRLHPQSPIGFILRSLAP